MRNSSVKGGSFRRALGGNPPVVHVISQVLEVSLKELAEVSVHHSLEEGWRVHQAKIHDLRDESPVFCFKHHLVLVFFCNSDVVVSPSYVELREESLISQVLERFPNIWERVVVPDRPLVDFSIVHNDALLL